MKDCKRLLVGLAALALTLLIGTGTASAAKLYRYTTPNPNDALGVNQLMQAALETSAGDMFPELRVKDTSNNQIDTCRVSGFEWKIEEDAGTPKGAISAMTLGTCSDTTVIIARGSLEISHIVGTTNGTLTSKGLEVTIQSTSFGISCVAKTGAGGTSIGTVTGAKAANAKATIDINAVISFGICGSSVWTGSYTMEEPVGLTIEAT
jgi:hypothetical protein